MIAKRATLRLRVMSGVVVITLIALAAFDFTAVTIMRGYLLRSTTASLQRAGYVQSLHTDWALASTKVTIMPTVGAYSMTYVPFHGRSVVLQAPAAGWVGAGAGGRSFTDLARKEYAANAVSQRASSGKPMALTSALMAVTVPVYGGTLVVGTSLEQVNKTVDQVTWIVTFGSLAAVLGIGGGVFYVLRRGMRPIESMAVQADRITAGDLANRVDATRPGSEIGRLGTALNGMLDRIETFVDEREADQEQMRRFFADASHELRTPLASVRANAELYQQGAVTGKQEVDEVMRRIVSETHRMSYLVDDMLRLARLGQHPVREQEPVDVVDLVAECVDAARATAPERTWRLAVHSSSPAVVEGDAEMLRSAVGNLLANVRTHTPPNVAATVAVGITDDTVTIEVTDEGQGVPPEELPHVFERFYRGSSPMRRPGSGLGLAIVSGIAAAHRGRVSAEANSPHGLRVALTLPLLPVPALV
jgi:two-component system OmpR family sensor kinase